MSFAENVKEMTERNRELRFLWGREKSCRHSEARPEHEEVGPQHPKAVKDWIQ